MVGGTRASIEDNPFAAYLAPTGDTRDPRCTGVVVAPNKILTAHCVDEGVTGPKPIPLTKRVVVAGRENGPSTDGVVAKLTRIVINPEYDGISFDSAVLTLDRARRASMPSTRGWRKRFCADLAWWTRVDGLPACGCAEGMTQIGVLVGNPRPASRTLQAALALRDALAGVLGVEANGPVVDAATLAPAVFTEPDTIKAALEALGHTDVLVVSTPTYKAAYTGLLKAVLDQAPSGWLRGKVVVPLQIAASDRHALAVEVHLRPVLTELGALVPQVRDSPGARGSREEGPGQGRMTTLEVRRVRQSDPDAAPLVAELTYEYTSRYGPSGTQEMQRPADVFEPPHGQFLLLMEAGEAVAGGAFMRYDGHTAELKRIWTHSQHRRRGLARRILVELENEARAFGYRRIHLTTGPRQPEAKALYLATGYTPLFDVDADPLTIGALAFDKRLVGSHE